MAEALRRALLQVRGQLPQRLPSPYNALFPSWDTVLAAAAAGDAASARSLLPAAIAESHWQAANPYRPDPAEDVRALAALLRELPHQDAVFTGWSEAEALEFAAQVLPRYQQAFAEDVAGDSHGLLYQAFTIKRLGAVPLEVYIQNRQRRYLDLGLSFADRQWATPTPEGLTSETRYWIDDMFMITAVQVEAYRATSDVKYLDRAALEMVTYLDRLQQPNGPFHHAPDAPFFWGRGNGWVAE